MFVVANYRRGAGIFKFLLFGRKDKAGRMQRRGRARLTWAWIFLGPACFDRAQREQRSMLYSRVNSTYPISSSLPTLLSARPPHPGDRCSPIWGASLARSGLLFLRPPESYPEERATVQIARRPSLSQLSRASAAASGEHISTGFQVVTYRTCASLYPLLAVCLLAISISFSLSLSLSQLLVCSRCLSIIFW